MMERVVVTGLGVASPLGCTLDEFWAGLISGRSGIIGLADEEYSKLPSRIAGVVTGYQESDYFDRKELRRLSRSSQLAVVASSQAIADAGLTEPGADPCKIGVIIGSSIGGYTASDSFFKDYYLNGRSHPLTIPISMNMAPGASVSIRNRFQGPLMTVDAACASAAQSVGYVLNLIRFGLLDIAITGGADSPLSEGVVSAWCAMRVLSENNDDPAHACRPFSADRDGLVLGEGAGILVLESESSALRRGRRIWAEIKGYGATSDSFHLTQPTVDGPARAMRLALEDANLPLEAVNYINAHGTATDWNDRNETAAIKEVFGPLAYQIPVVSNKSALGHSIAASGALELISSILSLRDQCLPPTINYASFDPNCDLDYVTEGARPVQVENILSNSFAFGGSNAVLIAGKYH